MPTVEELREMQSLSLEDKIRLTEIRIEEAYNIYNGMLYLSFSGGLNSTVLLDITKKLYPNIPVVFCNTGLEFPEIISFVKSIKNITWLKPKLTFKQVIDKYGHVFPSKESAQKIYEIRNTKSNRLRHKRLYGDNNKYKSGKLPEKWKCLIDAPFKISGKCCDYLKKEPFKRYERETGRIRIEGTMALDSQNRKKSFLNYGCIGDGMKRPRVMPMGFWNDTDNLEYIKKYELVISSIYNKGYKHTGCMFCLVGAHKDDGYKFKQLKQTHPKLWEYCMNKLNIGDVLEFIGVEWRDW